MTPLLEWYERDERDHGLGDMPYPPDYPKMPGEPPRVQPSRINPDNWTTPDGLTARTGAARAASLLPVEGERC